MLDRQLCDLHTNDTVIRLSIVTINNQLEMHETLLPIVEKNLYCQLQHLFLDRSVDSVE